MNLLIDKLAHRQIKNEYTKIYNCRKRRWRQKVPLIGRLLYDSKSILADQLEALEQQSKNKNDDGIDLAILTDGLRAEREQGITIDVAYRYFATPKRKFIIADAPGHTQYTRNMITGASNSQLIIS